MGLFGESKTADPKEKVREWQRSLRGEQRKLDRQITNISREERKAIMLIKEAGKKNDLDTCKILAKEIVRSRKVVGKLHTSKAQINSVMMNMQHQVATLRMAGALKQSTEVMHSMQSLVRVPEVAATMRELSKEMVKAGIMEEMIEDTLDAMEPEDVEEEAEAEVDKVLNEVLRGKLTEAPAVPVGSLSVQPSVEPREAVPEWSGDINQRLNALRAD